MKAKEVKARHDIILNNNLIIRKGEKITISENGNDYFLWHHSGVYSLDEYYIGEEMLVLSDC
jgi:hypothetical protein